jgi:hypothetical protein
MSAHAELSSSATVLDELIARIKGIADGLSRNEREALSADLFEVDRNLGNAARRLARLVESTGRR